MKRFRINTETDIDTGQPLYYIEKLTWLGWKPIEHMTIKGTKRTEVYTSIIQANKKLKEYGST